MSPVTESVPPKAFAPDQALRNTPLYELQAMLQSASPHVRTRALIGLGPRINQESAAAAALLAAVENAANVQASAMNVFSVAMIGAMVGLENASPPLYSRLVESIKKLPQIQQQDLYDYLRMATKVDYTARAENS